MSGLVIGGVIVYKAESWARNKTKAYITSEDNRTANQIILKKRKVEIGRKFPNGYLGKL